MIVIEDDPIVSAGGGPETTLTDPAITPQSSPQRSPRRKFIVSFLLSGAQSAFSFVDILLVDLCRSRAATSGMPGSWPRSAICFDYAAKGGFPVRERSPAREDSLARGSTVDPAAAETATADLGTGDLLVQKLSLGFFFY